MYILVSMHKPPAEGNVCNEHRYAQKPINKDCSYHKGYINKGDRTVISIQLLYTSVTVCATMYSSVS
jgi:hypothetical protein